MCILFRRAENGTSCIYRWGILSELNHSLDFEWGRILPLWIFFSIFLEMIWVWNIPPFKSIFTTNFWTHIDRHVDSVTTSVFVYQVALLPLHVSGRCHGRQNLLTGWQSVLQDSNVLNRSILETVPEWCPFKHVVIWALYSCGRYELTRSQGTNLLVSI